jgi:hypothetical protein
MLVGGLTTLIFDEAMREKESTTESLAGLVAPDLDPLLAQRDSPSSLEETQSSPYLARHRGPDYGATSNTDAIGSSHPTHAPQLLETTVNMTTSTLLLILFTCIFVFGVIFQAVASNAPRIWNFGISLFIAGRSNSVPAVYISDLRASYRRKYYLWGRSSRCPRT